MRWDAVILAVALTCAAQGTIAQTVPSQDAEAAAKAQVKKPPAGAPAAVDKAWTRLHDDLLNDALNGHELRFEDGHRQGFGEDGSTRRSRGNPTMGFWKIDDDDRLCMSWPPSEDWTCYEVARDKAGGRLRLNGLDGRSLVGDYDD